ncbi:MAG: thioesterase family protein [Alphaproteobacteria bacterium]
MNTAAIPAPFCEFHSKVEESWLDFNGHMNVAYYTRAFDDATDLWWTFIGVGPKYVKAVGRSVFAVEAHTVYKRELRLGDALHVTTRLLGFDQKRIHLFFELYQSEKNTLSATQEMMAVHVDMTQRAAVPFPKDVLERMEEILKVHSTLPVPEEAGRRIALAGKRTQPSG